MIFYRLRVDAVWQHQPFVIVSSKPKLLPHWCKSPLRSFSFLCSWRCPAVLPAGLFTAPSSVCFGASEQNFAFSILVLHEITLAAQSNSASALELQLVQPRFSLTPFVPCEPFFSACSDSFQHLRLTASSTESHDSPKYRLSVSICIY